MKAPKPPQDLPSWPKTDHPGAILAQLGAIMAHVGRNLPPISPILRPSSPQLLQKFPENRNMNPKRRPKTLQDPAKPPFSSISDPPSHHIHWFSIPLGIILNTNSWHFQVHQPIKASTQPILQPTRHIIKTIPRQPQQTHQCPNAGTVAGVAKHLGYTVSYIYIYIYIV